MKLNINNTEVTVNADGDTPLLWVIRDELNYTGTKFGCGMALCGACTVHVDGQPTRSCSFPLSAAAGRKITTIEGLSDKNDDRNKVATAVQKAWVDNHVPQCGYCQSGQIMTTVALLRQNPKPTDQDIDQALGGHICRCGTYQRIRTAVKQAAKDLA